MEYRASIVSQSLSTRLRSQPIEHPSKCEMESYGSQARSDANSLQARRSCYYQDGAAVSLRRAWEVRPAHRYGCAEPSCRLGWLVVHYDRCVRSWVCVYDCSLLLRVDGDGGNLCHVYGAAAGTAARATSDQTIRVCRSCADVVRRTTPAMVRNCASHDGLRTDQLG